MLKRILFAGAALALAACQTTGDGMEAEPRMDEAHMANPWVPANAEEAAGREVFRRCQGCHSIDTAKNTFGPSLRGIYMRPAASVPRFAYSDALKASGITWDEDHLRAWISGNDKVVHETRMRHVAITDPAEQDYLIAFLKSL